MKIREGRHVLARGVVEPALRHRLFLLLLLLLLLILFLILILIFIFIFLLLFLLWRTREGSGDDCPDKKLVGPVPTYLVYGTIAQYFGHEA